MDIVAEDGSDDAGMGMDPAVASDDRRPLDDRPGINHRLGPDADVPIDPGGRRAQNRHSVFRQVPDLAQAEPVGRLSKVEPRLDPTDILGLGSKNDADRISDGGQKAEGGGQVGSAFPARPGGPGQNPVERAGLEDKHACRDAARNRPPVL